MRAIFLAGLALRGLLVFAQPATIDTKGVRPALVRAEAEAGRFKETCRSGVGLPLIPRVEINIALQVGGSSETVSVTAEVPLVDTSSNVTAGRIMDNREVNDLPTFNNSPLMLIKLVPGIESS